MKKRGKKKEVHSEKTKIKTKTKAQGEIITTVLIILLVLAAVVIVWNVVKGTIDKAAGQVDVQPMLLGGELGYSISSSNAPTTNFDILTVNVNKKGGGGAITGVGIIVDMIGGNSFKYESKNPNLIPKDLETKPFPIKCGETYNDIAIVGKFTGAWPVCDYGFKDSNNVEKISKITIYFIYTDSQGIDHLAEIASSKGESGGNNPTPSGCPGGCPSVTNGVNNCVGTNCVISCNSGYTLDSGTCKRCNGMINTCNDLVSIVCSNFNGCFWDISGYGNLCNNQIPSPNFNCNQLTKTLCNSANTNGKCFWS